MRLIVAAAALLFSSATLATSSATSVPSTATFTADASGITSCGIRTSMTALFPDSVELAIESRFVTALVANQLQGSVQLIIKQKTGTGSNATVKYLRPSEFSVWLNTLGRRLGPAAIQWPTNQAGAGSAIVSSADLNAIVFDEAQTTQARVLSFADGVNNYDIRFEITLSNPDTATLNGCLDSLRARHEQQRSGRALG